MSNEEVIKYLTQIKGVGQWTVEMILMFTLGREDVFALDDLGIQQAICKLYKIDASNKKVMKEKMLSISKKWSPYRTYACRYLWGWKDNTPNHAPSPFLSDTDGKGELGVKFFKAFMKWKSVRLFLLNIFYLFHQTDQVLSHPHPTRQLLLRF